MKGKVIIVWNQLNSFFYYFFKKCFIFFFNFMVQLNYINHNNKYTILYDINRQTNNRKNTNTRNKNKPTTNTGTNTTIKPRHKTRLRILANDKNRRNTRHKTQRTKIQSNKSKRNSNTTKRVRTSSNQRIHWNTPNLCARVEGRSSIGRLGITVHITAGFIDAGFKGNIVLEIKNLSPNSIVLYEGLRVAQLVFEELTDTPSRVYGECGNKYQGQKGVVGSLLFWDEDIQGSV